MAVRFVIIVFICRIEFSLYSHDGARNESDLKNMIRVDDIFLLIMCFVIHQHIRSWSSGKMSQMKAHVSTNATSSPSATTSPVPRVLQVQGSKHSSVSSLHRQLMFHGQNF